MTFDRDPSAPYAVTSGSAVVTNLDADKLDGYEAAALAVLAEDETVSGAWTFTGAVAHTTGDVSLSDSVALTLGTGGDADIIYDGTNLVIKPRVVGTGQVIVEGLSMLLLNDTTNTFMTTGLTINQGGADDELLAGKSSDVAHAMTAEAEADTYFEVKKFSGDAGGVNLLGLSSGTTGIVVQGYHTTDDTTHTAAGTGAVHIIGRLRTGTTVTSQGTNANVLVVRNASSTVFIVDAEGNYFSDDTGSTYADWDDPMLALAVEYHFNPKAAVQEVFSKYCQYNKQSLIEAGIIAPDGPNGERGFVNNTALTKLAIGGVWQLALQNKLLKEELNDIRGLLLAARPEGRAALPTGEGNS